MTEPAASNRSRFWCRRARQRVLADVTGIRHYEESGLIAPARVGGPASLIIRIARASFSFSGYAGSDPTPSGSPEPVQSRRDRGGPVPARLERIAEHRGSRSKRRSADLAGLRASNRRQDACRALLEESKHSETRMATASTISAVVRARKACVGPSEAYTKSCSRPRVPQLIGMYSRNGTYGMSPLGRVTPV